MQVLTDLKQCGVQDILICCVHGLKGFPETIEALFPLATVQTCIVHLIRHSLKYVPRRQYDVVVKDLKPIYTAISRTSPSARSGSPDPPQRGRRTARREHQPARSRSNISIGTSSLVA
jgi:putative transposase